MNRLTIGRRIAIAFAATVVLLFSIDTTMACRFLWRSHCYSHAPVVYYCPPAYKVVTYPSCGSSPARASAVPSDYTPAPAGSDELMPIPDDAPSSLDDLDSAPIDDDSFDPPPNDLDPPPADDGFDLPADETTLPDTDLPDDDFPSTDLPDADMPDSDLPGVDLPDSDFPDTDLPSTDLPDADLPATDDDDGLGDLFDDPANGDDAALPDDSDDFFNDPPPGDDADDSLDELFNTQTESEDEEPRVADNPDDDAASTDPLGDLDDLGLDTEDADLDADLGDDLFPLDDEPADLLPPDDGATTEDEETTGDDLDDLFGVVPKSKTRTATVQKTAPLPRVWVDNTGRYQTVAKLVKIGDSHVRLLKNNGRFTTVPKTRLSSTDVKYVQQMAKTMGTELLEHVAQR